MTGRSFQLREKSIGESIKGCVQGYIGRPNFWNVILESLLYQQTDKGIYCYAFADDVVFLFAS